MRDSKSNVSEKKELDDQVLDEEANQMREENIELWEIISQMRKDMESFVPSGMGKQQEAFYEQELKAKAGEIDGLKHKLGQMAKLINANESEFKSIINKFQAQMKIAAEVKNEWDWLLQVSNQLWLDII